LRRSGTRADCPDKITCRIAARAVGQHCWAVDFPLARRVEQLMRVRIAGQEALQANHVRTGFRTNQDWTAGTGLDQSNATLDQCSQDPPRRVRALR